MAPIRNSGRVFTPAPYTPQELELSLKHSPNFEHRLELHSSPDGAPFSHSPRCLSSTGTSPASSGCALFPSPASSPAISTSSVSDYAPSPNPRKRASRSPQKPNKHVRRPPNPFIIFRSAFWDEEKKKNTSLKDHRLVSKMAGAAWNKLSAEEKAPYRQIALEVKVRHEEEHPGYRYTPVLRKKSLAKKRVARTEAEEELRCQAISGFLMNGLKGEELAVAIEQLDQAPDRIANPSPALVHAPVPMLATSSLLDSVTSSLTAELLLEPAQDLLALPSAEQVEPVYTVAAVQTPQLTAPIDHDAWAAYVPPECQPQFSDSLMSGHFLNVAASTSNTEDPLATLDADAARLLYDTLMNSGALCSPNASDPLSNTSNLPDNCFTDTSSTLQSHANVQGFQGALGFHPYFDSSYADIITNSSDSETPSVPGESQSWATEDFHSWFNTESL